MRIAILLGAGLALLLLYGNTAFSQQLKLGLNPYTVQKSALLELSSTNQGLLLARINDTSLINSLTPPDGMVIFFTPTKQLMVRSNGFWQSFTATGSAITNLNGLTAATQTFATGTAGTDFAISSTGSTHTFNIPSASATARGLVTTGAQTIAGSKTFTSSASIYATNPLNLFGVAVGTSTSTDSLLTITNGLVRKLPVSTFATAANFWSLGGNNTGGLKNFGTLDNNALPFITNGAERMRINNVGQVGIGVTDPGNPLVVKDTLEIRRTGALSELLFTNTAGTGDFRIGGDGGDIFWQGGGGRSLQMGAYWTVVLGGDRQSGAFPSFITGGTLSNTGVLVQGQRDVSVPLAIQANSATQSANLTEWRSSTGAALNVVDKNGNVGLGTTAPASRLHVTGTNPLTLNGVQTGATTDSILTITAGTVRKLAFSAVSPSVSGTTNFISKFTSSSALGNSTIQDDGSLISTTAANGLLATGSFGNGGVPAIAGAGTRLMWIPSRAAFRAGNVAGTQWDSANIGSYSIALGRSNIASGLASTAFGLQNTASGQSSTALGQFSTASGSYSTVIGSNLSTNSFAGSMILGDGNGTLTSSDAANQLLTRFTGGYKFFTDVAGTAPSTGVVITPTGNVGIGTSTFDASFPEKLLVQAGTTSSYNLIEGHGRINNYLQINIQNDSAGTNASSDLVATANNGNESANFVDLGINSGSFTGTGVIGGANNAYLYSTGNDFAIGNGSSGKALLFFTGGVGSNERMRITGTGTVGINTTTPAAQLDVAGTYKLGATGTANKNVISFAYTLPSAVTVPAGTASVVILGLGPVSYTSGTVDVSPAIPSSTQPSSTRATVSVSPDQDLPANVSIASARLSAATTVKIRFHNGSTTATTLPAGMNLYITITEF